MSTAQLSIEDVSDIELRREATVEAPRKPTRQANPSPASEEPTGEKQPTKGPARSRRKALWLGIGALLLVGIGAGSYMHYAAKFEETDNAYVEADVHPISTRVAGTVQEVLVDDNEAVTKGQVLALLDPRDFEVRVQSARTELQQAAAQIPQADAALIQAQAQLRETESRLLTSNAQLEKAQLDFERADQLFRGKDKVIAKQEFDSVRTALDAAQSNHAAAQAARDAAAAGVSAAEANRAVAVAKKAHAETAVTDAELQLSYTKLTAPASGRIGKKTLEAGQRVQPGQALMAVVADGDWLVANFKENQLSDMRPGQAVDITIDAIEEHHFRGHVESFAPGTGAKFSLLPPDNATGNFTKIVQRVPVKILFDAADVKGFESRIAPGLSAIATVRVKE